MSNEEVRQNILNECTDYIRHLLIDIKRLDGNSSKDLIKGIIYSFTRTDVRESDEYLKNELHIFLRSRIPAGIFKGNTRELVDFSTFCPELAALSSKIGGGMYNETEQSVNKLIKDKRYFGAFKKLVAMYELLSVIPSLEEIQLPQVIAFDKFNQKFNEVKKDLKTIRRNDSFIDKCTDCFIYAIESLLHFLNPLRPYGSFFQSTGAEMTGRVEKLLLPEPENTQPSWSN